MSASIATLQIINAQYTRGFLDAQPRDGYFPKPQASGSYQECYYEGYNDGSGSRSVLAAEDRPFLHMRDDNSPKEAFSLVKKLRKVSATIDSRFAAPHDTYRVQCEAAASYFDEAKEDALVDKLLEKAEARARAKQEEAFTRTDAPPAPATEPGERTNG